MTSSILPIFVPADPAKAALNALRSRIRHLESGAGRTEHDPILPFGDQRLDKVLGGGLPLGRLHEIASDGLDSETGAAGAGFSAAILGRIAKTRNGMVLWAFTRDDLYAPGLARFGLLHDRLLLVNGRKDEDVLAVLEEGLRLGSFTGVLGEVGTIDATATRRLQLACEKSGTTGFILRRWSYGPKQKSLRDASSVATRWRVVPHPSESDEPGFVQGLGPERWRVDLSQRNGRGGAWIVEMSDATGHVRVVTELADNATATRREESRFTIRQAG